MFCQYCGSSIVDTAKFCPNCGKPTAVHADATCEETAAAPEETNAAMANASNVEEMPDTAPLPEEADITTNDASEVEETPVTPEAPTEAATEADMVDVSGLVGAVESVESPADTVITEPASNAATTQKLPSPAEAPETPADEVAKTQVLSPAADTDATNSAATAPNQEPNNSPVTPAAPPSFEANQKKEKHAVIVAGIAVGAIALLLVIGVIAFALPMFQFSRHAGEASDTVITLSDLEDRAWARYLAENVDRNNDGLISQKEAALVTSIGNLSEMYYTGNGLCSAGVTKLDGIEYFTNLKVLLCYDNTLESLDLSQNTSLRYLDCSYNYLTSLTLPATDTLQTVSAERNLLQELDVTDCPNLNSLTVDQDVTVTGWTGDPNDYVYDDGMDDLLSGDQDAFDEYLDDQFGDGNSDDDNSNQDNEAESQDENADTNTEGLQAA